MKILHKLFKKHNNLIGVECDCGVVLIHNCRRTYGLKCPSCGSLADVRDLIRPILLTDPELLKTIL